MVADTLTPAGGGGVVNFTITITNNGPLNATGVQVTFNKAALTYVSDTGGVGAGGVWNVGNLNAGASATITFTLNTGLLTVTTVVINTAEVTGSAVADPSAGNNLVTVTLILS
jgi:uncharacterized repeat protein (TIGR01451 family)